jgi:hypothetical protein
LNRFFQPACKCQIHHPNKSNALASLLACSVLTSAADNNCSLGGDLFVGYKFSNYIALEADYLNLGEYMISGTQGGSSAQASAKVSGLTRSTLRAYPLNDR